MSLHDTSASDNRCYLIGPFSLENRLAVEASLKELEFLCLAAGLLPVGSEVVRVRSPRSSTYLGSGQVDRTVRNAHEQRAGIIVFDLPLSPVQLRNWARISQLEIYDRHAIILEIFSRRARSREAQLQVELARAQYAQSHLVGMWQHLSRQGGGSRLARGEGETQIEMDRRQLARRVRRAKRALAHVGRQRSLRRKGRDGLFRVALVGYTNAGKSSLMNALTATEVHVADQLFATLDPATRRLYLSPETTVLLSDTVGFVRRLPPELVEAFHSTLEEVVDANLLLIVVDAADPEAPEHLRVTRGVLSSIGADSVPHLLVVNKMDRAGELAAGAELIDLDRPEVPVVHTSARNGTGINELKELIRNTVEDVSTESVAPSSSHR